MKPTGTICGPRSLRIMVDGKWYEFDDCYPAPWPVNKRGYPMFDGNVINRGKATKKWEGVPFWQHRFWKAVWWWAKQGKKVNGDEAVYEPVYVRVPVIEQVTRRTRVCRGYTDEMVEEGFWGHGVQR
jgi:hypothetical protein